MIAMLRSNKTNMYFFTFDPFKSGWRFYNCLKPEKFQCISRKRKFVKSLGTSLKSRPDAAKIHERGYQNISEPGGFRLILSLFEFLSDLKMLSQAIQLKLFVVKKCTRFFVISIEAW